MKTFFSWAAGIVAIAALCFVGAVAFNIAGVGSMVLTAPGRVINETLKTENIIGNYEYFIDAYNNVIPRQKQAYVNAKESYESFLTLLPADREKWKTADKAEASRLNSILLATKNIYVGSITEYNSKSKMLNRNIFKDRNLPYELSPEL